MRPSSADDRGFSLVEITLALGIAAFALVSVITLLGTSLSTSAASGRDTVIVGMSNHVLNDLRTAYFNALWLEKPIAAGNVKAPTALPVDSHYFFTAEGVQVEKSNLDVIYECIVRKTPDAATSTSSGSTVTFNLLKLELFFSSPVAADDDPDDRPNRQTLRASIARY